jgi:integrase|uniref:Integrase n=1 Tax=Siphoviridae sp. ct9mC1 TaxID=2827794 RepID=A0A8S5SFT7_9CAUD|nr:MAG TPA: Integrase [Siphoviridae sp. ct9mC1]
MGNTGIRRDKKHRVLRKGESVRANGKYQFKYHVDGKPHFVYSWRLEPTDPQPAGKAPCRSLRELEKEIGRGLDSQLDPLGRNMTVNDLVERYLKTRTGVRPNTLMNYGFVKNILAKEEFGSKKMCHVKTSDAKLFLIKMQQDGKGSSTIKTVRGVLCPAFQMAVDDDMIVKNPFGFQLAGVIYNTEKTRQAITKDEMKKFLKFVHDDNVYCKYYEVFYILFHTGMRISEFCGLTLKDVDMKNRTIDINHQLQRTSWGEYIIEPTKTNAGTRKLPMTDDVFQMFQAIIEDRSTDLPEIMVQGYAGFLFRDKNGMPEVVMHWEHRFNHAVKRYNDIFKVQMPNITPHVCRHTYCSNMARARMNPKTLQYLMGHSDISVTMNVYTHLGFDDAKDEMIRLEELEAAKKEVEKVTDEKPISQKMFKAI